MCYWHGAILFYWRYVNISWYSLSRVLCKGTYTSKMPDPAGNCVAYNISFILNKTLITKFFFISADVVEWITFEKKNKNW